MIKINIKKCSLKLISTNLKALKEKIILIVILNKG